MDGWIQNHSRDESRTDRPAVDRDMFILFIFVLTFFFFCFPFLVFRFYWKLDVDRRALVRANPPGVAAARCFAAIVLGDASRSRVQLQGWSVGVAELKNE